MKTYDQLVDEVDSTIKNMIADALEHGYCFCALVDDEPCANCESVK